MVAKASEPTAEGASTARKRTFHSELRDDGSLPLPPEIVDELSLEPGTIMAITASNGHFEARPVALEHEEDDVRPMPARHPAQGVLKDYFHGWDDIQQFITEERRSWDREWDMLPDDTSTDT
jgi:hypothetical protein